MVLSTQKGALPTVITQRLQVTVQLPSYVAVCHDTGKKGMVNPALPLRVATQG